MGGSDYIIWTLEYFKGHIVYAPSTHPWRENINFIYDEHPSVEHAESWLKKLFQKKWSNFKYYYIFLYQKFDKNRKGKSSLPSNYQ